MTDRSFEKLFGLPVINPDQDTFESFADLIARAARLEKFIKDQGDWNLYKLTVKDAEND